MITTSAASSAPSGTPYHRLQRSDPRHRWWRPLLVGLVAAGLYVAAFALLAVVVGVVGLAVPSVERAVDRSFGADLDAGDPLSLAVLLGMLALLLPAVLVAARLVGARPAGLVSSVAGRLRWRWLGAATLVAFAIWTPVMAVWTAVEAARGTLTVAHVVPGTSVELLVVTLALVPFQAAAEEYVFRGYLAQLVGSWLRHPLFAVLLPVPLFVLGHGYDTLGAVDVGVFAVVLGWVTWRTGGLEAAIGAHVANNVVLMSLMALGLADPNATDVSVLGLVLSVATMTTFAVLVTRRADALGTAQRTPAIRELIQRRPASSSTPTTTDAAPMIRK